MTLPTCCEFHGMDEDGCNQGRACPAHKPVSYVADDGCIGYEAALSVDFTAPPAKAPRAPLDWQRIGLWSAVVVTFVWCLVLSIH